jgi:integrase
MAVMKRAGRPAADGKRHWSGTSEVVKLTERVVMNARPLERNGTTAFRILRDSQRQGFALRVSASGAKSYIVIRRVPGAGQVNYKFGNAGELTVAEARVQAEQLLARMARGENPAEERQQRRVQEKQEEIRGITLAEAAKLAYASARAKGRSAVTVDWYEEVIDRYMADWLNRPLVEITRQEANTKHAAIARQVAAGKFASEHRKTSIKKTAGRSTANAVFRVFRLIWNRALRQHPELPACPVINVDWFAQKPPRTAHSAEALPTWYAAVLKSQNPVRKDYLLFVLFSGMRRRAAAEMRWQDVDLKTRTLHVPAPKGGEERAFDLPLSDFMIELLERRKAEHDRIVAGNRKMAEWVWPADSESGHLIEAREDGIPGSIHDLRRTFITVAANRVKIHPYDLRLLVNHSLPSGDVTAGYVAPNVEQLRVPMQSITNALRALCGETPPSKRVVPLERKRA